MRTTATVTNDNNDIYNIDRNNNNDNGNINDFSMMEIQGKL